MLDVADVMAQSHPPEKMSGTKTVPDLHGCSLRYSTSCIPAVVSRGERGPVVEDLVGNLILSRCCMAFPRKAWEREKGPRTWV